MFRPALRHRREREGDFFARSSSRAFTGRGDRAQILKAASRTANGSVPTSASAASRTHQANAGSGRGASRDHPGQIQRTVREDRQPEPAPCLGPRAGHRKPPGYPSRLPAGALRPVCKSAVIQNALMKKGRSIELQQRRKPRPTSRWPRPRFSRASASSLAGKTGGKFHLTSREAREFRSAPVPRPKHGAIAPASACGSAAARLSFAMTW